MTINHKPYILLGCLIWIASFFGEIIKLQPYSTIGISISPLLTFFGIFHWFKFYKTTRGHYPRFFRALKNAYKKMKENPFAGMGFTFKHLLESWTFFIVCWMCMVLIMFLTFGQSSAFNASKEYCNNNSKIIEKTGKIEYYGILISGKISNDWNTGGSAELNFTIVGENGNFTANAELIKYNDIWEVTDLIVQ